MIKQSPRPIYFFIGIGGIGMSALARYYKAQGCRVLGSDAIQSETSNALRKEGIKVFIGHRPGNLPHIEVDAIIYNRAIRTDNPELAAAKRRGLRTIPYAEALGELTRAYRTIAITGSHGKSTTTALAALTLIHGGLNPTVLVGTNLKEFGGKNIRLGKHGKNKTGDYLVLEADDFGAAFWAYSPAISIITNIDREHLDFYKNLAGVKRAFLRFAMRTVTGGVLILNRDDKNLFSLKPKLTAIARAQKLKIFWYSVKDRGAARIKKAIQIPGEHNLSNAMAVVALAKTLKISEKKMLAAIGSYHGAWRRMEYRGEMALGAGRIKKSDVSIYDDYAHHPTEIKATLQAFREKFPVTPIICVFQPHQAKRLQMLYREFSNAFSEADVLILLPLYAVTGRDSANPRFTAEQLAETIKKANPHKIVRYLPRPKDIKKFLKENFFFSEESCYRACVVMMGAGDIVRYTNLLLR